jgi:murein L,D-transpeptidase YcbB/YkuD
MQKLQSSTAAYCSGVVKQPDTRRACFALFLLALWLAGSGLQVALAEQQDAGNNSAVIPATGSLLAHIDAEMLPTTGRQPDWQLIRAFYASRDYLPVWTDGDGLRHEAYFAIDQLARSAEDGLFPEEYHLSEIRHRLDSTSSTARGSTLELLLTDGMLRYIRDIRSGRLEPRLADAEWHIRPSAIDPVDVLTAITRSDSMRDALQDLPPRHRGYRRLKSLLQAYRSLEATGGWPLIPPGEVLERGMYDQRVHLLRHRLMLAGGPIASDYRDSYQFDAALESAVRDFQERYGLEADGIVGRKTLAALNLPVGERIQQILLNMERWRWMPGELGERYLLVNMAGFELLAVENEETVMDMRVIIGRPYRSTPAFAGEMRYLVFNPYWNVPHKLAIEDLLPKQQSDPDYLQNQGFRVYASWRKGALELDPASLDWSAYTRETFGYRLRQDPGDSNSLGRIKFMLPNPHAIYLHDTPARHLFRHPVRTFSSGCIRVEKPVQLANFVLQREAGIPGIDVQEAIDTGENRTVSLPRTIPVYLLYLTSWVDDKGRVHFRDDVYGRDVLVQRAWGFGSG